ncbi:MAG: SMP-30/gluconolactonase/LRE family protein [Planctomycetota bacterium]|jgi:DNA-binding beta-propeller fold protein YncE/ABC-type Fe3+ transport system permease subunit
MRGSAWWVAAAGIVLWAAAVAYPLVASFGALGGAAAEGLDQHAPLRLLVTSTLWAGAVALLAALLGWLPGRLLGAALGGRGFVPLAVACLLPICLPAYLVFYAWWQAWPADSMLYQWAVTHELIRPVRLATLFLSLSCWSWPIVAWCVSGGAAFEPLRRTDMTRLDGAGRARRVIMTLRTDGPALGLGAVLVFLVVFNNTTCFDLAEVFTIGNELRAIAHLGATPRDLLVSAMPTLGVVLVASIVIWSLLQRPTRGAMRPVRRAGAGTWAAVGLIWGVTVAGPLLALASNLAGPAQVRQFVGLYHEGLLHTLGLGIGCAGLAAVVAVGLGGLWQDHRPAVRGLAHLLAVGWIVGSLVPATVTAAALEAAYNIPVVLLQNTQNTAQNGSEALAGGAALSDITVADLLYRGPAVLVLGHLARFGIVAVLLGRWLARQEALRQGDMRRLDGAESFRGWMESAWPRLRAAVAATVSIVLVLSVGEVALTAQLQPPGFDVIATTILNDMHYQRPQTVMVAALLFVLLAVLAAVVTVLAWAPRRWGRQAAAMLALALVSGCGGDDALGPDPLRPTTTFGAPGLGTGQFNYPRGIAVDRDREYVFVVDKTARVQRFGFDGEPQAFWQMPEWELGKPTGLNVAPDGSVWVADTHYFRVIAYDADGRELRRFGSYGEEPGQFIYPTDVEFGRDGRVYVSEYGGNDRVQVFSSDGEFQFSFGTFGEGPGQFNRPQSMVFSDDGQELFIADACNHRIVVVDTEGRVLRYLAGVGRGPGELMYPYDLTLLPDGSLLVCEFGNNRIQRLSAKDGRSLDVGGGEGPGRGRLRYPWGIDTARGRVFVLDSGNNRVQILKRL